MAETTEIEYINETPKNFEMEQDNVNEVHLEQTSERCSCCPQCPNCACGSCECCQSWSMLIHTVNKFTQWLFEIMFGIVSIYFSVELFKIHWYSYNIEINALFKV